MSYKPFRVEERFYSQKNKDSKYEVVRMKLFGFRSGAAWKMIPALAYYFIMGLIIFSSIMGEIREFKFETVDVVLCVLKYIFILILVYSPAIFLSEFKYNKNLPFFRSESLVTKAVALIVVDVCCVLMIWTYQYCMSDTYKSSADAYYEKMDRLEEERLNEYNRQMEVSSESIKSPDVTNGSQGD